MTTDPVHAVLRDFENIAWLTILLGLILFAAWRFFFPTREAAAIASGEPVPPPAPAIPAAGDFTGADLVILPLVLIKFSLTLQIVIAYLSSLPARLAGKLVEAPPAAPVAISPAVLILDLLLNIILISLVIVMVQWVGRRNFVTLFGFDRLRLQPLAIWIFIGSITAIPLVVIVSMGMPDLIEQWFGTEAAEQAAVMNIRESTDPLFKALLIFNAVLVAPVVEEIVFRGYFYGVMKRHTSALFAAFVTAAIFAAAHQNLLALIPLFGLALLFTLFYEASRCLWVPIGIHAAFNATNVVLILSGFGETAG